MPKVHGDQTKIGDGAMPQRHFVNHVTLRLSLSDIEMDILQLPASDGASGHRCRLVTTPDHLSDMHATVGAALDRYVAQFGPIASHSAKSGSGDRHG